MIRTQFIDNRYEVTQNYSKNFLRKFNVAKKLLRSSIKNIV